LKTHRIAVIAGDGIGPEVIEAAIPILERVAAKHGFSLAWERLPYSADHYLRTKETLPDAAFRHLRDDVAAIFLGALGDPSPFARWHKLSGLTFVEELNVPSQQDLVVGTHSWNYCVAIPASLPPLSNGLSG